MLPSIFLWLRKFLMPLTDVFNLSCPKVITKTSVKNLEKLMQVFTSPKPTETVAFLIFRFFFRYVSRVQPYVLQPKHFAFKSFLDVYGILCAGSKKHCISMY